MAKCLVTLASLLILAATQLNGLAGNRTCSAVDCPEGCELETDVPQQRCPWCVCPPITATRTLRKFEDRHCPRALMEHVNRVSQELKSQIFQLSNDVRQQNVVLKNVERLHRGAARDVQPSQCPTPLCAPNCTLVTGDNGCPDCSCPPGLCPPKACPPTCHLETPTPIGRCPECVCDGDTGTQHGGAGTSDSTLSATRQTSVHRRADDSSEESSEGDGGSDAPLVDQRQCATPMCARNCTLVTGDHGCPDCECPPTHCPRQRCPRFCHRETPPPADRCPECICEVTRRQPESAPLLTRTRRHHHKATNDTSEESSEESDEQGGTGGQGRQSSSAVRAKRESQVNRPGGRDDSSVESLEERDSTSAVRVSCATPLCDRNCTVVIGDRGCPECECPPTHCPRQRCPANCRRESPAPMDRCPECVCEDAPLVDQRQCATPMCASNCTLVTGDHGCPDCECPPTHCPRQRCPRFCHRETPPPAERCPECICEVTRGQPDSAPLLTRTRRHHHAPTTDTSEESSEESDEQGGTGGQRRQSSSAVRAKRESQISHSGGRDDSSEESSEERGSTLTKRQVDSTLLLARTKRHHHKRTNQSSEESSEESDEQGAATGQRGSSSAVRAKRESQIGRPGVTDVSSEESSDAGDNITAVRLDCATPLCDQNCTVVIGDRGCPECECPPTHCPRQRCPANCRRESPAPTDRCPECVCEGDTGGLGVTAIELDTIVRSRRGIEHRRRSRRDDDSSEESSEEDSGKGHGTRQQRSLLARNMEGILKVLRRKRHHHLGAQHDSQHTQTGGQVAQHGHEGGLIQCAIPNCEQHCTRKPGPHGCLVCDCPGICPDIVCGSGCHPEYTEGRRCQRCICNPHIERQTVDDIFNAHCGEGHLRSLLIEFVNLKETLGVLEQQLSEHDREIRRIESIVGTTGQTAANTTSEGAPSTS